MAAGGVMTASWSKVIRLDEVPLQGRTLHLSADEPARAQIARDLDLLELTRLEAELTLNPWFDGVEVRGAWRATVAQACVVTLERLDSELTGEFTLRVVPPESRLAPRAEDMSHLDPEAEDPPDVSDDGELDLAGLVVEHLALEIDPYPRKEGAAFEPPPSDLEASPFAVLRNFKPQ
jgi:uncharacterized metal-binding protein YceD (DUF177 family)